MMNSHRFRICYLSFLIFFFGVDSSDALYAMQRGETDGRRQKSTLQSLSNAIYEVKIQFPKPKFGDFNFILWTGHGIEEVPVVFTSTGKEHSSVKRTKAELDKLSDSEIAYLKERNLKIELFPVMHFSDFQRWKLKNNASQKECYEYLSSKLNKKSVESHAFNLAFSGLFRVKKTKNSNRPSSIKADRVKRIKSENNKDQQNSKSKKMVLDFPPSAKVRRERYIYAFAVKTTPYFEGDGPAFVVTLAEPGFEKRIRAAREMATILKRMELVSRGTHNRIMGWIQLWQDRENGIFEQTVEKNKRKVLKKKKK